MKTVHCLALTAALSLCSAVHAAIPTPAPAERQVVADAGKRTTMQTAAVPAAKSKDEASSKPREAAPRNAAPEVDFTLHWYSN